MDLATPVAAHVPAPRCGPLRLARCRAGVYQSCRCAAGSLPAASTMAAGLLASEVDPPERCGLAQTSPERCDHLHWPRRTFSERPGKPGGSPAERWLA